LKPALVRGDAKKFYRTRRPELYVRGMNVYPTPMVAETPTGRHHTVGVHLTPTFDLRGQDWVIGDVVTVGPKLVPIRHLEDLRTPMPPGETFLERLDFFPQLGPGDLEDHQSGIQARLDGYHDFYIAKDRVCPQVIQLVGLDSPALTAAPAIARRVAGMMGF
jgi:L-2-hydroxyglutarate oxidase LhgO